MVKNIRGKTNNLIGLDLLTKQAEVIVDLLSMAGYRREAIMSDLENVVANTFSIKQKGLNKIELSKEIIAAKQALTNTIEAKLVLVKNLHPSIRNNYLDFMTFHY